VSAKKIGPDIIFGEPHGPDGWGKGDACYPLPEWCSSNDCEDERCHRCFPRSKCKVHEKCVEFQEEDEDDGDHGEKFSENYNGGYGTYTSYDD